MDINKMKIKLIEAKHRCIKCKTPLNFICNYIRSDEEIDSYYKERGFWKTLFKGRVGLWVDRNRQYWDCPKCYESYLVDIGEKL